MLPDIDDQNEAALSCPEPRTQATIRNTVYSFHRLHKPLNFDLQTTFSICETNVEGIYATVGRYSETRLLRTLKGNEKRYVLNKVRFIQNKESAKKADWRCP